MIQFLTLQAATRSMRTEVPNPLPNWIPLSSAVVTAVGLIVLGGWAFFRYRRGRTFMPRCSIAVVPSLHQGEGSWNISASVKISNSGDAILELHYNDKAQVEVSYLDGLSWARAREAARIEWPEAEWRMKDDILAVKNRRELKPLSLEPRQEIHRSCLFRMPHDWSAARVTCLVTHGDGEDERAWRSSSVVVRPIVTTTDDPQASKATGGIDS